MSTPKLVEDFYGRIWNDGHLDANFPSGSP